MMLVDPRKGSKELMAHLPSTNTSLQHLEYADVAFAGNGADGETWMIGIERKTIGDLVDSMVSGRLAGHQITGLINAYNVVYILVEGLYRPGKDTTLLEVWKKGGWSAMQHGQRTYMYMDVSGYKNTLQMLTPVYMWRTMTMYETCVEIMGLYRWWNSKKYSEHRSHLQPNMAGAPMTLAKHSVVQRVAACLDGVGVKRAVEMDKYAGSVLEMVAMEVGDWEKVPGIGKVLANRIFQQLRG